MLRSMFYMATAVLLSTKTARSGSYLNTESLTSYTCTRYQVFPNLSCTLEPHVTSILELIVNWYCTISMIAQEREKLKKDEFSTNIPNQGNSFNIYSFCCIFQNPKYLFTFVRVCVSNVFTFFFRHCDRHYGFVLLTFEVKIKY